LLGWKTQEELQVKAVKKLISGDENVDSSGPFQEVLNTFMSSALTIVMISFSDLLGTWEIVRSCS